VGAEQPPASVLVGDPQALEREDQRIDRELRQQQKADRVDLAPGVGGGRLQRIERHGLAGRIGLPLIMIKLVSIGVNSQAASSCLDRAAESGGRRCDRRL
jgi:hypothetical protein